MKEQVIKDFAGKSGISENLASKIKSLSRFLEQIISEKEDKSLMDELAELPRLAFQAFEEQDDSALEKLNQKLDGTDTSQISKLLKYYTVWFHLVNSLEQHEITRINRQRAFDTSADSPRSESIAEAVYQLKEAGYSFEEALAVIQKLDIQPTITAHPTEARRHSVLVKQQHITSMISRLEDEEFTQQEQRVMVAEI